MESDHSPSPVMDRRLFSELVRNPSECTKLSIKEKGEFVRELSKCSQGALEMLYNWSRKELLEVLCAEMGKERKYTSSTKQKLIEHLLQIVSNKKTTTHTDEIISTSKQHPTFSQSSSKRQRKTDHPSRLPVGTNYIIASDSQGGNKMIYCRNIACRAPLNQGDAFCRRCSCCICYTYDDNKDPSLWLVCSSDPPSHGDACGMTCHLECALNHERAVITMIKDGHRLDGNFYCVSCGKINDLLRYWKKQLLIAKDARRVDVLCHRVSLSHKLLDGSEKYASLHHIVDDAMKKLEAEVGPLNCLPTGMARGIVNRLSSGSEVQKLCNQALEMLDSMFPVEFGLAVVSNFSNLSMASATSIKFEDVSSTSVTALLDYEDNSHTTPLSEVVGYKLWHRKTSAADYLEEPTCRLAKPDRKFIISKLVPATDYLLKVIAFSNEKDLVKWEVGITTKCTPKDDTKRTMFKCNSPKLNCSSPKTNSSGLSNPSEGGESYNSIACGDLNKLPEEYLGHFGRPEISIGDKETIHSQATQEGTTGHSGSALDEEPHATIQTVSRWEQAGSMDQNHAQDTHGFDNGSKSSHGNEMTVVQQRQSESVLPVTPSKLEACKDGSGRGGYRLKPGSSGPKDWLPKPVKELEAGNPSKKKGLLVGEEMAIRGAALEGDYEYSVKAVRWLECEGHIETNFRVKFLTWLSLRATPQERKVVSVFVDTLIDDPPSLAGQLIDTFSEGISSSKGTPAMPRGLCMKLWH